MFHADWVIITAPTDRGSDPAAELVGALEILRKRLPDTEFRVAVLGGQSSTITVALDDAAMAGARRVLVMSGQTLGDRKMDAWFRRVIGHWIRARAADVATPEVHISRSLCAGAGYADLLAATVNEGGEPAGRTTAPLLSPLWEKVPAFSRHVLVCRGPRCSAHGSAETARVLTDALDERGLDDDDVLVTYTGCMFPCVQAPVVAVYPDDVWYAGLTADRVAEVVDRHLCGGEPVADWLGERSVHRSVKH